jgi:hypothetical protein
MRDPIKLKAKKARYLRKIKIEKFGIENVDKDMRGRREGASCATFGGSNG